MKIPLTIYTLIVQYLLNLRKDKYKLRTEVNCCVLFTNYTFLASNECAEYYLYFWCTNIAGNINYF